MSPIQEKIISELSRHGVMNEGSDWDQARVAPLGSPGSVYFGIRSKAAGGSLCAMTIAVADEDADRSDVLIPYYVQTAMSEWNEKAVADGFPPLPRMKAA